MAIEDLINELNEQQKAAATTQAENVLVLAGAGCGKTKTIVARAAYLINQGVPASEIQIVTFTRRAAAEIVSRVGVCLGNVAQGIHASTFHTFCMGILRRYSKAFKLDQFNVIDRDDQVTLFKMILGKKIEALKAEQKQKQEKVSKSEDLLKNFPKPAELADVYSYTRNTLCKFSETLQKKLPDFAGEQAMLAEMMREYYAVKRARGYLDYDDILDFVAIRLEESPSLVDKITQGCRYLLIDEMQDTNPLQWKLIKPFIGKAKLFCVGDDAQSIYGFRGADFENVHSFKKRVPNSEVLLLEKNYRSTQQILDVSNWLLKESALNYNKTLTAFRGDGHIPELVGFTSEFEEADWIARNIRKRHDENDKPWNEHMILVRSSFAGKAIERSLIAANIPYEFIGGTKLFESAHVKDLLSMMRLVVNKADEIAWTRFLSLWSGVGINTASKWVSQMNECHTLIECVAKLREISKIPPEVLDGLEKMVNLNNDPAATYRIAFETLESQLAEIYQKSNWEKRIKDFDLVEKLAEKHASVSDFIEAYILEPISHSQVREKEIDDVVTLITIHSAKGTEREVCFVPNLSPGMFPHTRSANDYDEIEEERRVLYVALTRAKNELIMTRTVNNTWSKDRYDPVGRKLTGYFFNDLPKSLYNVDWHTNLSNGFYTATDNDFGDEIHVSQETDWDE